LVPFKRSIGLSVDHVYTIEVTLELLKVFDRDAVNALESVEILENYCQIEIFDTEVDTFEAYNFNVVGIQNEEGELGQGYKAVFGGPDAHDGLCWAAVELQALLRDVNFDGSAVRLTLLLNQPREPQKFGVKTFTSLALSLFLFKLIHIVEFVSSTAKINVLSSHS
jgi:hypothetical protein